MLFKYPGQLSTCSAREFPLLVHVVCHTTIAYAMEASQTSTPTTYAVSRSRGKQPGESRVTAIFRKKRKEKGLARESDESEPEEEMEPG